MTGRQPVEWIGKQRASTATNLEEEKENIDLQL
jgi:hypothetical protein